MNSIQHYPGENLFEEYLASQKLTNWEFEREYPGKSRLPDYTLHVNQEEYLFDVKEFKSKPPESEVGCYDPYDPIREKIEAGRKKFKEYKDWPCCLVLYSGGSLPLINLEDPNVMFGAMLGDCGVIESFNPAPGVKDSSAIKWGFLDRGKMFRPKTGQTQNTTISALIALRHVPVGRVRLEAHMRDLKKRQPVTEEDWFDMKVDFDLKERELGVVVFENPFARIPLSSNMFIGPYDKRYKWEGNSLERVFVGTEIMRLYPP